MYKIYINQKPLILISDNLVAEIKNKDDILLAKYPGKTKFLLNYIDMLEKGTKYEKVFLYDSNLKQLYKDIKKIARPEKAAGGLVFNENKQILAIFRKGFWDLPKGHLRKKETKKEAAIREVMEETGIKDLKIAKKAGITYHIYRNKKRHLKISHWYFMHTYQQNLTPQKEEDIEDAIWIDPNIFVQNYNIYPSIRDLLLGI